MRAVVRDTNGAITTGGLGTSTGFASLFMPSARALSSLSSVESHRSSTNTYAVGYREAVSINCRTGGIWKWRRVVFSSKDPVFYNQTGDNIPWTDQGTLGNGSMTRSISLLPTPQYIRVRDVLFDGQEGVDWADQFLAKVDTTRVTLHSDKTTTINPGNETGKAMTRRFYYPLKHNIVYDEDEAGETKSTGYLSVGSKLGMGNVMIYDVFVNTISPAGGGQELTFIPHGTYYWHER